MLKVYETPLYYFYNIWSHQFTSAVMPISMFHLWHSYEIRRNLQIPANSQSHWGIGLISIWWLSSSLIFLLPWRLEQTMFHILFSSALWVWVHNKGNWMSDSTVLKLWKNNPDLKLCFSFQRIQKSWAPYITEATVCWPESLQSESVICFWKISFVILSADGVYIFQRWKKLLFFSLAL